MDRRDFVATFLRGAGCFALASAAPFPPRLHASSAAGRHHFPQGLASGDPTPSTVVLWTRVESTSGSVDPVPLVLQVSPTEDFARVVAEERLIATAATDFTVRVLVEAQHYCMKMRGTKQPSSTMVTMAAQGVWEHDHAARREVLSLIRSR